MVPRSNDTPAYIICTSGTTGTPKKVYLTEENICWLLDEFYKLVNFSTDSKFLFTTPYTFDVSLTEILAPVFTGGTLICIDVNVQTLKNMPQIIKEYSISHLSCPPSLAEMLLETSGENIFKDLKSLSIAGEEFPVSLAQKLKPTIEGGCEVYNFYGPSETTIYATYYQLKGHEVDHVPIGKPIPGVKIKILSQIGKNSKEGELAIGGKGVSKGYLLQPDLNQEKFKVLGNGRFYLSGDFVYYNKNLDLVFEGRKDNQIKINGIRLEVDELSSIVNSIENIISARVAYSNKILYIFYKADIDCSKSIVESLPSYLKPKIVKVDEYLFTFNRKLDIRGMVERYYHPKGVLADSSKLEDVKILKKINNLLSQYGVLYIKELDSLDTVRFFLDIEEEFRVKIDNTSLVSLNDIEKLLSYIKNKYDSVGHKEPILLNNYQSNVDILNLKLKLDKLEISTSAIDVPLTCTQKKLKSSPGIPIIYCEFRVKEINTEVYYRIKETLSKIAAKIDLFRTYIVNDGENTTFKKVSCKEFIPMVIIFQEFIPNDQMVDILRKQALLSIPITVLSMKQKIIRFYFFYHSIDASSLNMVGRLLNDVFEGTLSLENIPVSSFFDYINYIQEKTSSVKPKMLLDWIPKVKKDVLIYREDEVFTGNIYIGDKKDLEINTFSIFSICQHILKYQNLENIVITISYNFREYKDFDASKIVGDLHTKIPIMINRSDNIEIFEDRLQNILEIYKRGIDIRQYVFSISSNTTDLVEKEVLQRWNNISLSLNYIGEVLDPDELIKDYRKGKFSNRSILLFSSRGNLYYIMKGYCFK